MGYGQIYTRQDEINSDRTASALIDWDVIAVAYCKDILYNRLV